MTRFNDIVVFFFLNYNQKKKIQILSNNIYDFPNATCNIFSLMKVIKLANIENLIELKQNDVKRAMLYWNKNNVQF